MSRRNNTTINQELAIVNAQLDVLQRRENEFQQLIQEMQRLKESVQGEKSAIEAKREALHAERQPINWLPPELLISLFFVFVDNTQDADELYHRPPVIISHVCQRWRRIALSTSHLWSRISYRSVNWNRQPLLTFLERSGTVPLDIAFSGLRTLKVHEECRMVSRLFDDLSECIPRWKSVRLQCWGVAAMEMAIIELNSPAHEFPCLQSLDLSITTPNPAFQAAPTLLNRTMPGQLLDENCTEICPSESCIKHIRLVQVPLFNVPTRFLSNLKTLELSFPPKNGPSDWRYSYKLRMSQLCRFLRQTTRLEDLVLTNTVPFFDVTIRGDTTSGDADICNPVELPLMKRIDWSYPYSEDVHRFLSFLILPSLEKLDLCLEEQPANRTDIFEIRGYHESSSSTNRVLNLSSLVDLSLQCVDDDAIGSVFRKFTFPVLENVEITNVNPRARRPGNVSLPTLPRLESIFRDPRLPHLTHLSLSHFEISSEQGRVEAMLGYMPVLISLSLDSCTGVGKLMEGLKEKAIGVITPIVPHEPRRQRGIRVCPRLESITLWGCGDVQFDQLHAVVTARNISSYWEGDDESTKARNGVGLVTGTAKTRNVDENGLVTRKIKPLRKPRRQGQGISDRGQGSPAISPSANILSTIIAMEEAFRPARVMYVRIGDCQLIGEEETLSLKDLGVIDVVWSGSEKARK